MTHQQDQVEPPLTDRIVQRTLVAVSLALLMGLVPSALRLSRVVPSAEQRAAAPVIIDLNRADVRELAVLPGIGPVLAQRIAANRERNGPFRSAEDLARVHGVGAKTIAQLQGHYVVHPTAGVDVGVIPPPDPQRRAAAPTGSYDQPGH